VITYSNGSTSVYGPYRLPSIPIAIYGDDTYLLTKTSVSDTAILIYSEGAVAEIPISGYVEKEFKASALVWPRQQEGVYAKNIYPKNDASYDLGSKNAKWKMLYVNEVVGPVDNIYPVGSVYITVNKVNPKTIFPGTEWTQICERFFVAASDITASSGTYTSAKLNGGANTVTLTVDQIPRHTHGWRGFYSAKNNNGGRNCRSVNE